MFGFSFYGLFIHGKKYWVELATFFRTILFFRWFNQVVTKIMFTAEIFVILLVLKFLPSNAAKKLLVKNMEHKLEKAFSDGIRRDVGFRHFILLSVAISQQLLTLTSLYFSSFFEWPLKLNNTFCCQNLRWLSTTNLSWKLEIFFVQVTIYKALFKQYQHQLSTHSSLWLPLRRRILLFWPVWTHMRVIDKFFYDWCVCFKAECSFVLFPKMEICNG